MSHLERQINKLVFVVVALTCLLSIVMAVTTSSWFSGEEWDDQYLTLEYEDAIMSFIS